jgi:hypothetical protein
MVFCRNEIRFRQPNTSSLSAPSSMQFLSGQVLPFCGQG